MPDQLPNNVEIKYTVEILDANTNDDIIEAHYISDDPQDDEVIVFLQIDDPDDIGMVNAVVKNRAPLGYWTHMRLCQSMGVMPDAPKDKKRVKGRKKALKKGSPEEAKHTQGLRKLIGKKIAVTALAGHDKVPEIFGDHFTRMKLRQDMPKDTAGEI